MSLRDRIAESYPLKLGLSLAVIAVLVVGVGVATWYVTADTVREDTRRTLVSHSEAEADRLTEWLARHRASTRLLSDDTRFADDPATVASVLAEADRNTGDATVAIHFVDTRSERILASSLPERRNESVADRPWIDRLEFRGLDDVFVSEPYETSQGRTVIAFVSPTPARINGAVAVVVDVGDMAETFRQPVKDGFTTVVDSRGRVIFHRNASARLDQYVGDESIVSLPVVEGTRGHSGYLDESVIEGELDGDYVTAYAPVEGTDWVLIYHAPAGNAYAVGRDIARGIVAFVLVALGGVALVGLTFGRGTIRSVRRLASAADDVAGGDYDREIDVDRRDELGTLATAVASMRDTLIDRVSAAQSARERAEKQRLWMESILDNVPVGVFVVDADRTIVRAEGQRLSPAFDPDTAEGKTLAEQFGGLDPVVDGCRRAFEGETTTAFVETDAGSFESWYQPVDAATGYEVIVVVSDVTERRYREQQVQVLNRVLRHTLRNRLNVVIGWVGEIRDQLTDPERKAQLDEIETDARDLVAISDKVRRAERAIESEPSPIDVVPPVERALEDVESEYPRCTVELAVSDVPQAYGSGSLELAVRELVENAIEHSPGSRAPTIRVTVDEGPDEVTIQVDDDGEVPPDVELSVLEEGKETPLEHGSGLGLWIVYWVVSGSGGRLSFDTSDLGGFSVTIHLPAAAVEDQQEAGAEPDPERSP